MEIAKNKKAFFDYEILEKIESGIVLTGGEVKSAKLGQVSLKGSYVTNIDGKFHLTGAHISAYQPMNQPSDYNVTRPRPILLQKKEIRYLIGKTKEKGLTLIPLRMYTKRNLVKLEIGLAKGKKKFDKREKIKKREDDRQVTRSLKNQE
jgi:SsrA-binding protein